MEIVFAHGIGFDEPARLKFENLGVKMYEDVPTCRDALVERMRGAGIVAANFVDVTPEVIDASPALRYIIAPGVGHDRIATGYAASKGIKVLNCPTQNAPAVGERTLALMLSVAQRIPEASADLRQGNWNKQGFRGIELTGRRLGLLGHGRVGQAIEQVVGGLAMQINYVDSKSTDKEKDELVSNSDVVCLCLPLNDSTRNILNAKRLRSLHEEAIVINVARGGLLDEAVLYELLQQGTIWGAGLDAFEHEPSTGKLIPASIAKFAALPNVLTTPHNAYDSKQTARRLGKELWEAVMSCLNGQPLNVVNQYI